MLAGKVHGKPKKSRKIARYLFPLTPGHQGPATKPCKVLDKTLTKFVRCLDPCPRESYGVCPQAQANVPGLGTSEQRIFYFKPQVPAHSFCGLFGILYGVHTKWFFTIWGLGHGGLVPIVEHAECIEHVPGLHSTRIFYRLPKPKPKFIRLPCFHK